MVEGEASQDSVDQRLAAFEEFAVHEVETCPNAERQAETILKIAKTAQRIEERVVDPHLKDLVPHVLAHPPLVFEDKRLWSHLINQSCDRQGKALKDPKTKLLCSLKAKNTNITPNGFFALRQKHLPSGEARFESGSTSKFGQKVTVEDDAGVTRPSR